DPSSTSRSSHESNRCARTLSMLSRRNSSASRKIVTTETAGLVMFSRTLPAGHRFDRTDRDGNLVVRIARVQLFRKELFGRQSVEERDGGQDVAVGFDVHAAGREDLFE